ncbi:33812_t:CDS:2, partial [Gigaspora margarita]
NITVNDPLVTKHRGRPPTKRLKSSSETQDHTGLTHSNHAINPQDPNLRISLSNISLNNNSTIEEMASYQYRDYDLRLWRRDA